jgi:hypothetical protein
VSRHAKPSGRNSSRPQFEKIEREHLSVNTARVREKVQNIRSHVTGKSLRRYLESVGTDRRLQRPRGAPEGAAIMSRLTEAEARAEYDTLVPIMALEGRTMDAHSREVFVEYLQGTLTIDDLVTIAKRRNGVTG